MWTTVLTCQVGLARIGMFVTQPFYTCDAFNNYWSYFIAVWLSNLAALCCLTSIGRFNMNYKANVFLFCFQATFTAYLLYEAIMFQCPPTMGGAEANLTAAAVGHRTAR